jgi:Flp pilus assembly protein TadD
VTAGLSSPVLLLGVLFFAGVLFFLYSPSLEGPFIFDDEPNIELNGALRLTELTPDGLKRAAFDSPMSTRPVSYVTFALNYYVHEYRVFGYRVTNLAVHLLTGIFLFLLLNATLATPALASRYGPKREIALFASVLWLVHPVATQSVAYIVQRMTSLAALFYVLALLLYVWARQTPNVRSKALLFSGCCLSGLLALGSKEIAATLPIVLVLYEWYFLQDLSVIWLRRRLGAILTALIGTGVATLVFLGDTPLRRILSGYASRDFTLPERVLTEFRVVVHYLGLIAYPHPSRLNLDYDWELSRSFFEPVTTIVSMSVLLGLLAMAIYFARQHRLLSFGLLWFLGNLLIESSVIALEIIFEHRTYVPSMFIILLGVVAAHRFIARERLRRVALTAVVVIFSAWTYQRAVIWGNDITLWQDVVAKSPEKPRANHNLGIRWRESGQVAAALPYFERAVTLDPEYFPGQQNLASALLDVGDPTGALEHFASAVALEPDNHQTHLGRGHALAALGRSEEAIEAYQEALRVKPGDVRTLSNLGGQLVIADRESEAVAPLTEAIRLDPNRGPAHYNLGLALAETGEIEEGIRHLRRAIELEAGHVLARRNLAVLLLSRGDAEEAINLLTDAVRLAPGDAAVHNELGVALLAAGRFQGAVAEFEAAIALDPSLRSAHQRLDQARELAGR